MTATMVERFRAHYTVARFDDWVRDAQPGARQSYGFGLSSSQGAPPGVAARMRELYEHGLVQLFAPRTGYPAFPFRYEAHRTSKPLPRSWPRLAALARPGIGK